MISYRHYFDAEEFAAQAAKPKVMTVVQFAEQAVVILPPIITDAERASLGEAYKRTQHLSKNGGAGMRS